MMLRTLAVLGCAVALGAGALVGLGAPVSATQGNDCQTTPQALYTDGPKTATVATAEELFLAVRCFNQGLDGPGSYRIVLAADMNEAGFTIDQPAGGFDLTVDGGGFTLSFGSIETSAQNAAPTVLMDVSVVAPSGGFLWAIRHAGPAGLTMKDSTVRGGEVGTIAVSGSGSLTVENSILEFKGIALYTPGGGPVLLSRSTVRGSFSTAVHAWNLAEGDPVDVRVENSTLEGGLYVGTAGQGTVAAANSTIAEIGRSGQPLPGGVVQRVTSSLVGGCGSGVVNGGFNAGGCFGSTDVQSYVAFDNGCVVATPAGCVPTVPLAVRSSALGAGICAGVPVDQRGRLRTPDGVGCDAGAFESDGGPVRNLTCGGRAATHVAQPGVPIFGTIGDDVIVGSGGDDEINGSAGNDLICGFAGNDTLEGGFGDDTIFGGAGDDTILGGDGFDLINGQPGDDTIDGGDRGDEIYGALGNDTILGGGGWDRIWGNAGIDIISGGTGNDNIHGGAGDDILSGDDGHDLILGENGDDVIDGGPGHDRINGQNGEDTLDGGSQSDRLWGGFGDDTLRGGLGWDLLLGGWGADTLEGGPGNDILFGFANDDTLDGGSGNDRVDGGWANDALDGGPDTDVCDGDIGVDTGANCETSIGIP